MKSVSLSFIAKAACVVMLLFWIGRGWSSTAICDVPSLARGDRNHPEQIMAGMVNETGGLPQVVLDDYDVLNLRPDKLDLPISDVKGWNILGYGARNVGGRAQFGEPHLVLTFSAEVTFADDSIWLLEWSEWRDGWVICPIISAGGGPPGAISMRPLSE